MEEGLDFFAIGDVVVDDFIRLKEASVHCTINSESCEICMRWGDKIPFEFSIRVPGVGNAPNAAVAAARLGLTSGLQACVGDDLFGSECLASLQTNGVRTQHVTEVQGKHTNYHYVLWYESERTILIKHETFTYEVPRITAPRFVYLSSLGKDSLSYHELLAAALPAWGSKLAFQPGTFQIAMGTQALKHIYEQTYIFFCNKEEAEGITGVGPTDDIHLLLEGVRALGPDIVVITNDRKGAYAYAGTDMFFIPMYPDIRAPYERTGAGDAFAASVTAALALGKPLEEALLWGPINAMAVVQEVGAQKGLLTREAVEEYMRKAPPEYRLKRL